MKALFIQLFLLSFICLVLPLHANCQPGTTETPSIKQSADESSNPKGKFETSDGNSESSGFKAGNDEEKSIELESSGDQDSQIQEPSDSNPGELTKTEKNRNSSLTTGSRKKSATEPKTQDSSDSDDTPPPKFRKKPKTFDDIVAEAEDWFVTTGIQVVVIFILTVVAMFFSNVISKNLFGFVVKGGVGTERKKRATTLSTISRYLMVIGILAVGGMMILKKLGVDIAPLLAGAGVLGIALGFGAQNLVKDIISGAFILLEDQIRVGDVIQIADKRGIVEKVTLRMVVLRDVSGNVHFIPSGDIQVVTNMTKTFSRYLFDIGVAYKENTDEVIKLVKAVDEEMRADEAFKDFILAPLEVMGVQRFESSAVIIRARTKTQPGKQWKVGREFNRRIKMSFDKNGIEIPFPHMTVYQGANKDGGGSPLNIHLQNASPNITGITDHFDSE